MFKEELNRQFKNKAPIYWIQNGYIYMPNSNIDNATGYQLDRVDESGDGKCNLILDALDSTNHYPPYHLSICATTIPSSSIFL